MSWDVVSSDDELLILVDSDDNVVGHETKQASHDGEGVLHRAFSIFLFNERGQLLLQQRSGDKRLWPLYWSNSCCSHPRRGETMEEAAHRRLHQELGVDCALRYLYKFEYQARYGTAGSENELCSVFIGKSSDPLEPNQNEIAACRFVAIEALDEELAASAESFTPWFKMEWRRIRTDFHSELMALLNG